MNLGNQVVKKKSFIRKIFKGEGSGSSDFPEPHSNPAVDAQLISGTKLQSLRVFAATWNVGGKSPDSLDNGLNLDDLLQVNNETDIYVLGFQETIPLNTGNVLVLEDNEPATKWLSLINQSLNKSPDGSSKSKASGSLFSSKPSLKKFSKTLRTESKKRLKSCNCTPDEDDESNDFDISEMFMLSISDHLKYSLIASKQLVGIFITIWARKEHIPFVSHLKISRINRGIMGCLGNKGCISVRFLFHQTSFCFVCSHLASGEKEGDELKRNQDVSETIKNTQFPDICKTTHSRMPDNILGHDVVIWLGDLNYRIALSYSKTRQLLNNNDLNALLDKDQLNIEREAERVFKGWKEGKICFAPTYKYSYNSDAYLGETETSKKNIRTPAWCDRILWYGNGITQLSYIRGESQLSDHRPVCATFAVNVVVNENELKKGLPRSNTNTDFEEFLWHF